MLILRIIIIIIRKGGLEKSRVKSSPGWEIRCLIGLLIYFCMLDDEPVNMTVDIAT